MGRPRLVWSTSGFSLPLVLIAAAILLVGGLMLALRSGDGLLSVLLQAESSDARDAAETGITRIVGELNRPRNRGLLVKDGADQDGDDHRWSSTDAASRNPCLPRASGGTGVDPTAPDLTTNASIGYQAGSAYRTVLLNAQGEVVQTTADAVKSYRLVAVRRQPLLTTEDTPRPSLRLFDAQGRGSVVLTVEGSALRNGNVISTVRLEEELQLVPKCCNVSFGGAHGDTNYAADDQGESVCISDSWGLMAGMANDGTGSMTINGVTTITDESNTPVNPLLCVAEPTQECAFNPTSTDFTLKLVQPSTLPEVRTNPIGIPTTVVGSIDKDTIPQDYPRVGFRPFLYCTTLVSPTPASLKGCPDGKVTIDASAAPDDLPDAAAGGKYCGVGNYGEDDVPEAADALHCNLAKLDYSQLTIRVEGTEGDQARALRLYFPSGGDVIRSTGGGLLEHLGEASDFALFGCAGCDQTLKLAGGVEGLNLFAWFPRGTVTVAGGSSYTGVLWANRITSSGGVTWTIPSAEVLAALQLSGFGLEGERNPPVFDWVLRSVRAFRWLGS